MSAPYVVACLLACLLVLAFAVWRMGKLNKLRVSAQITKFLSLSIEASSDNQVPPPDGGAGHHDRRLLSCV